MGSHAIAILQRGLLSFCSRRGCPLSFGRPRRLDLVTVTRKVSFSPTAKANRLGSYLWYSSSSDQTPCWVTVAVRLYCLYYSPAIPSPIAAVAATGRADTFGQPSNLSVQLPSADPQALSFRSNRLVQFAGHHSHYSFHVLRYLQRRV